MTDAPYVGVLCVRADSGTTIGIGHVMRCLALGQAWQDQGGRVVFVTTAPEAAIAQRLSVEGFDVRQLTAPPASREDAVETARIAAEVEARWMVVDGYHFDAAYLHAVRQGRSLLAIDDLADRDLSAAEMVLNQNVYAMPEAYVARAPQARLLLGSAYALLRREFGSVARCNLGLRTAQRVLLIFGGGDFVNATESMLRLFVEAVPGRRRLTLVAGPSNSHLHILRPAVEHAQAWHDVELVINPPDLAAQMAACDVAVSAAGTTAWELAALGVPMILVVTAENQRGIADHLAAAGAALSLGGVSTAFTAREARRLVDLLDSPTELAGLARAARRLVDGGGARRTVEALGAYPLELRPLNIGDARLVWNWANDPVVRESSFNREPIPWEQHTTWFQRLLDEPDLQRGYIACDQEDRPVGFIRFVRKDGEAELSFNLASSVRGRGWGAKLARLGAFRVADEGFCRTVRARVKFHNRPSLAALRRAGFLETTLAEAEHAEFRWQPILSSASLLL